MRASAEVAKTSTRNESKGPFGGPRWERRFSSTARRAPSTDLDYFFERFE